MTDIRKGDTIYFERVPRYKIHTGNRAGSWNRTKVSPNCVGEVRRREGPILFVDWRDESTGIVSIHDPRLSVVA